MSNIEFDCHNEAVRVIVRERPLRDIQELEEDFSSVITYLGDKPNILIADGRPFTFDKVLGPYASQEELFLAVRFLVGKVKNGYNCTALAYGQTGTGKSYSMGLGSKACEGAFVGIIPRCLREMLNKSENGDSEKASKPMEIYASFIEIYNEKVFDLLSDKTIEPISSREYKYIGCTRKVLKSLEDCYSVLLQGNKNRHVRPTKMNSQSSRSHAIFTIHTHTFSGDDIIKTRLNLVDLAGSEGVRRTGHQGMAMSEGVNINQGLLAIGKVLQAKAFGHKVVPYRDSVLTSVLQDSLNENSYLTLLACISPHRSDFSETLSTLRFAQSVKQLKHTPHLNVIPTNIKKNPLKTPRKPLMTPVPSKPNLSKNINRGSKVLQPVYHSNTFCTPSKLKGNGNADKLNQSEFGFTPKQKQKQQTRIYQSSTSELPIVHSKLLQKNRESSIIMNKSVDSRASIISLNVSSSTVLGNDGIASSQLISSCSPVVRKCMVEIENVMDNKMSQLMETIKDLSKENTQQRSQIIDTPWPSDSVIAGPLPLALRNELKTIIQEVLKENVKSKRMDDVNASQSILLDSSLLRNDPECQMFATSSPVFKVPSTPHKTLDSSKNSLNVKELSIKVTEMDNESKHYKTAIRRSTRLSAVRGEIVLHSSFNDLRGQGCMNEALRRSRRISKIGEKIELQRADDLIRESTTATTRKKNKSLKQLHIERRQSIREATNLLTSKADDLNRGTTSKAHNNASRRMSSLNDNIIERYFTIGAKKASASITVKEKKSNIQKHRKAVLDLLNTGSMKDLQILPQIGQKTAYQLVTQRTLSGKFKNISQLEKLTIWRGNSWARFAQANLLVD